MQLEAQPAVKRHSPGECTGGRGSPLASARVTLGGTGLFRPARLDLSQVCYLSYGRELSYPAKGFTGGMGNRRASADMYFGGIRLR